MKQEHLDELHASGITNEIIEAAGVYAVTAEQAAVLLGWERCSSGGLAYLFGDNYSFS